MQGGSAAPAGGELTLLWQFFRFHRYRLRFAFPIRNSYPTDIPRKVPLNCQSSANLSMDTESGRLCVSAFLADLHHVPPITGGHWATTPPPSSGPHAGIFASCLQARRFRSSQVPV